MPAINPPTINPARTAALEAQSDKSLAAQAQNDPAAFGELYHRHLTAVYRYHLARSGRQEDAEDLTAQTFFSALEGIHTFRGEASFAAWLFSTARRKTVLMYRERKRETPLETTSELSGPAPGREQIVHKHLLMQQVAFELAQLPVDRAEAIMLCVYGGLSSSEAGQALLPTGAAGDTQTPPTKAEHQSVGSYPGMLPKIQRGLEKLQ